MPAMFNGTTKALPAAKMTEAELRAKVRQIADTADEDTLRKMLKASGA